MFCPECGNRVEKADLFCSNCGFSLQEFFEDEIKELEEDARLVNENNVESSQATDIVDNTSASGQFNFFDLKSF